MQVLWLTSWYPSEIDKFSGDFIQRHALAIAGFCKVHVIHVIKDNKNTGTHLRREKKITGNLIEEIIYYSPPATKFRFLNRILSHRRYNQYYRNAISAYVKANGKPACVHVHVALKAGVQALWIKRNWKIPYVVTEHWTGYYKQSVPSIYDYNIIMKRNVEMVLKEAAAFIPVSADLGKTIKENFADIPYKEIPNVADTSLFYYKAEQRKRIQFIHVSYMNYQKNPDGILKACSLLKEKGYDFEILMLGNKDERLMELAKEYNLDEAVLKFESAVPYSEVALRMQDSSALLLFSRFENLPCVILEALCCGLPVISSSTGGIPEVVNQSNGILVKSENVVQLAEAMQHLIDNYSGYNRKEIAETATKNFNYATVGLAYLNVYKSIT